VDPSQVDHASSFTTRTRLVLSQLQQAAGAGGSQRRGSADGGKRRKLQQQQPGAAVVSAGELLQNKSRMDASRWFFELLVLRNKGFVDLQQQQAYGDVVVVPSAKLLA
jgi:cohesin complex subunit SCC1